MRRFATILALAATVQLLTSVGLTSPLRAQESMAQCASYGELEDACQKAADVFAMVAPQLGVMLAGGNAVVGQAGSIGGFGHLSLGLRATGFRADLPDLGALTASPGGAVPSQIATTQSWVALPVLDADIGLLPGAPVGVTYVGAVDLLLSAAWLPEPAAGDLSVAAASGRFRAGIGARVELLRESSIIPAVSLTAMRRTLPAADIIARTGGRDSLEVRDARVSVDSWRLVAGKSFLALALAAGVGQDRQDARASVSARLGGAGDGARMEEPLDLRQRLDRTNAFVNLSLNMAPLRLTGEIGRSWGGSVSTLNSFEGTSAAAPRSYGSVGLLIGF